MAFEGVEKVLEYMEHKKNRSHDSPLVQVIENKTESKEDEKTKINSAIKTDFILSIEIVIMALGTVLSQNILVQSFTIIIVSLLATFGVYGIVALIVKMDDAGFFLIDKSKNKGFISFIGRGLVKGLPLVIKALGVIGTFALLLVSGGIFSHNIDFLHHLLPSWNSMLKELLFGLVVGTIAVIVFILVKKLYSLFISKAKSH